MPRTNFRYLIFAILVLSSFGQTPPPQQASGPGPEVVMDGHVLFTIRRGLGPFSAAERAQATETRLEALVRDLTVPVNAVNAAPSDAFIDVVAGDRVLLTITEADAQAAGNSRAALAEEYVRTIRAAIDRHRAEYSRHSLLLGGLYSLLTTLVLLAILWALRRVFPALYRKLEASRGRVVRSIRLQRAELISARQIAAILLYFLKTIRLLLVVTILYFYLPLLLSFFPWTRDYAPTLLGYFVNPLRSAGAAFLGYLPSLIVVLIAILIAFGCIRISRFLFDQLQQGTIVWSGFYPEWAAPTHKIVRFLILAFTAVIIFPYLPGSESPAFRGISIFLGVLLSLGSSSAVANVVAGTILTYTRAFQMGDRIRIGDTTGDVVERTLLATRVRTIKNEFITVPNAMVLGSHITNFSSSPATGTALILHTTVTIGYDAPWRTVHSLLIAAALRTPAILKEPAPFVLQTALDDFYIHYEINACTAEPARMAVIYAELHQNIQDCFNEAGMEIMSPHVSALRDRNHIAIPDSYLPGSYQAPTFRVTQENR